VNKRITFSANEALIEEVRAAAKAQNTTLNDLARQWLAQYARGVQRPRGTTKQPAQHQRPKGHET
jgi:hypothetical protein